MMCVWASAGVERVGGRTVCACVQESVYMCVRACVPL